MAMRTLRYAEPLGGPLVHRPGAGTSMPLGEKKKVIWNVVDVVGLDGRSGLDDGDVGGFVMK